MMLEHLLTAWPQVSTQLKNARHILLLTDYDGTLTPIVDRPEMAVLSEDMRQLIRDLACQQRFTVGVISGRGLEDLKQRVGIRGIIYAGNHGLEIEGQGISFVNPAAQELKPFLCVMQQVLSRALAPIKGVFVENKGLSLSVHYRLAEEDRAGEVEKIVRKVVGGAAAAGQAKITSGKKVYEVRPAVIWDKGKAIKLLMKKYGKGGRSSGLVAIYFGDDVTDNDAFGAIERCGGGISVFVGEEGVRSSARYFLRSPTEVAQFLHILIEQQIKGE